MGDSITRRIGARGIGTIHTPLPPCKPVRSYVPRFYRVILHFNP